MIKKNLTSTLRSIRRLHCYNPAVPTEKDYHQLKLKIVECMKELLGVEGGTFYTVGKDQKLTLEIMYNHNFGLRTGGKSHLFMPKEMISLYDLHGEPNTRNPLCSPYFSGKVLHIDDIYKSTDFDCYQLKLFDKQIGRKTHSFLALPVKNHSNEVIGILAMINPFEKGRAKGLFRPEDIEFIEFFAEEVGSALSSYNHLLGMNKLFESFVKVLAMAIDHKSPYTGEHCRRVPAIAMMLADVADQVNYGPLADFHLTEVERYELELSALLHDCGKICTPIHIMDKATKLESIFDRIELIDTRFEILKRDEIISSLNSKLELLQKNFTMTEELKANFLHLDEQVLKLLELYHNDRNFLHHCNFGVESMREDDRTRVKKIAEYQWINLEGGLDFFLSADELKNLLISKGTLTAEDREIINDHIVMTLKMLSQMEFPSHLKQVPDIAGGHHERMDGKGFPRQLTREQMNIQTRILGIADIFEALTAQDRPYKRGKTLTESLHIMGKMKVNQHIDPDLFYLFIDEKVYLKYAREYLHDDQIDQVDHLKIPGYIPLDERVREINLTLSSKERKNVA